MTQNQSYEFTSEFINLPHGKLYYEGYGHGEPLIIIHGGPGLSHNYLKPQMLQLSKKYQIIFYDQLGSGKSIVNTIDDETINLEQFTHDLELLRIHLNLNKINLLSHSWGGLISLKYSIKYPDFVNKLILVNTASPFKNAQHDFINKFLFQIKKNNIDVSALNNYEIFAKLNELQINELYRSIFHIYFYQSKDLEKLNLDLKKEAALSGLKTADILAKNSWLEGETNIHYSHLNKLSLPCLIIHGDNDIIPINSARELAKNIKNSKLCNFKNCGHFSYIEQSKEFFKMVDTFIR